MNNLESSTSDLAKRIRKHVVRMTNHAKASHVGSCLSLADILAVLYGAVLRVDPARPGWPDRDRLILSKGHAAAAVYAALAEREFFPREWLTRYCDDGSPLPGHITHHNVPGVEVSTGSLGHGLPIGCGFAVAAAADGRPSRVFVLMSDGECDEGSNWEAILFAGHHKLSNLMAVVDYNKIQSFGTVHDVLDLEPFAAKWANCGWRVREIDGHDHGELLQALSHPVESEKPTVVIAHTVKGKGVSFCENQLAWHYKSPNDEQLRQALAEIEGTG